MPASHTTTRTLNLTIDLLDRAERELAAYFDRRCDLRRRDGWRDTVAATLATIPAYHLGVLSLRHCARVWPEAITKAFGADASIAIRLDCCDHPGTGSTPALEAAAAERLVAILAKEGRGSPTVLDLSMRAGDHFESAVRAYAKARALHDMGGLTEMANAAE